MKKYYTIETDEISAMKFEKWHDSNRVKMGLKSRNCCSEEEWERLLRGWFQELGLKIK